MIGLRFSDEPLKEYKISMMKEMLRLKIDESGAKMESRGFIVATKGPVIKKDLPREFILDRTFWLVMKEAKKHPYVCM